jgi:hypothetical protein
MDRILHDLVHGMAQQAVPGFVTALQQPRQVVRLELIEPNWQWWWLPLHSMPQCHELNSQAAPVDHYGARLKK